MEKYHPSLQMLYTNGKKACGCQPAKDHQGHICSQSRVFLATAREIGHYEQCYVLVREQEEGNDVEDGVVFD